jgi:hypothetical protein
MPTALPFRRLAALALALIVALALVACGGSDGGSEGGGGGDMQVDVGDGGQDMTVEVGGDTIAVDQGADAKIPDSWPADIPKPEGTPTLASDAVIDGLPTWTATFADAGQAEYDAYLAALEGAGGESLQTIDQAGIKGAMFRFGDRFVNVQLIDGTGLAVVIGNDTT